MKVLLSHFWIYFVQIEFIWWILSCFLKLFDCFLNCWVIFLNCWVVFLNCWVVFSNVVELFSQIVVLFSQIVFQFWHLVDQIGGFGIWRACPQNNSHPENGRMAREQNSQSPNTRIRIRTIASGNQVQQCWVYDTYIYFLPFFFFEEKKKFFFGPLTIFWFEFLADNVPGGKAAFRTSLALSFLQKFWLSVLGEINPNK